MMGQTVQDAERPGFMGKATCLARQCCYMSIYCKTMLLYVNIKSTATLKRLLVHTFNYRPA